MSRRVSLVAACVVVAQLQAARALPGDDAVTLRVDGRVSATPWIAASGADVAVAWGATANGKTDVFVATSGDGGRTFSAPVQVNAAGDGARLGGELPPRVELQARSDGPPEIVVLWTARADQSTTIRIARSTDGGRSFGPATTLQGDGAAGDRGWPALTLDRRGRAHAIWLDHRGMAAARAPHKHGEGATHDGAAMAARSGLYYKAYGHGAARERQITPGVCYCCKTALAAGVDGTLFAAWRHVYPGNIRDIAFSVSRDGGRSFSPPARVSEDRWQLNGCPDDGPAIAIDRRGTVHVVWPTVIADPGPEGAIFYATTRDGISFTPRVRVPTMGSAKPSHPQIAMDPYGDVVVAWDEVVGGTRVALARRATTSAGAMRWADAFRLDDGASLYPVLAATRESVIAAWTSGQPGATVIRVRHVAR